MLLEELESHYMMQIKFRALAARVWELGLQLVKGFQSAVEEKIDEKKERLFIEAYENIESYMRIDKLPRFILTTKGLIKHRVIKTKKEWTQTKKDNVFIYSPQLLWSDAQEKQKASNDPTNEDAFKS